MHCLHWQEPSSFLSAQLALKSFGPDAEMGREGLISFAADADLKFLGCSWICLPATVLFQRTSSSKKSGELDSLQPSPMPTPRSLSRGIRWAMPLLRELPSRGESGHLCDPLPISNHPHDLLEYISLF